MMRSKKKRLNRQESPQFNIDPTTLPTIECECGNDIFDPAIRIRRVSAIISPEGKAGYVHEPVMVCRKCSKLLPATP